MNWKRIARSLVCLLVICALLLNVSPLGVSATGLEIVAYIGAGLVLTYILLGLGLTVNNMTSMPDGTSLISALTDHVKANYAGMTDDEKIRLYNYSLNPDYPYYVDSELVELVRQWLFDNSIVTERTETSISGGAGIQDTDIDTAKLWLRNVDFVGLARSAEVGQFFMVSRGGAKSSLFAGYRVQFDSTYQVNYLQPCCIYSLAPYTDLNYPLGTFCSIDRIYGCWPDLKFYLSYSDAYQVYLSDSSSRIFYLSSDTYVEPYSRPTASSYNYVNNTALYKLGVIEPSGVVSTYNYVTVPHFDDYGYYSSSGIVPGDYQVLTNTVIDTDLDIDLDYVAPFDQSLPDGYVEWFSHSTTIPGDIADTDADVIGLPLVMDEKATQADVWRGTLEDVLDDTIPAGSVANTPWQTFVNALTDFVVTPILNGIKAVFVPSEDFLTTKVESLRSRFGFVDSVINTGDAIGAALTDFETSPPIIYMELSNAESKYDWGDRAIALDLRWYERYKPTVDQLLSAMLWLWFAWRVFRKLPDIISGVAGDVPDGRVAEGSFLRVGYAEDHKRLPPGKS